MYSLFILPHAKEDGGRSFRMYTASKGPSHRSKENGKKNGKAETVSGETSERSSGKR